MNSPQIPFNLKCPSLFFAMPLLVLLTGCASTPANLTSSVADSGDSHEHVFSKAWCAVVSSGIYEVVLLTDSGAHGESIHLRVGEIPHDPNAPPPLNATVDWRKPAGGEADRPVHLVGRASVRSQAARGGTRFAIDAAHLEPSDAKPDEKPPATSLHGTFFAARDDARVRKALWLLGGPDNEDQLDDPASTGPPPRGPAGP